tara:strand:+ start:184056 stop:184349 length:294 start_codon:yes stop_codon:yes gene_type:complete
VQFKSIFFLLAFTWCILTPAVVTICNIDTNISALFSMNEEETSETFKLGPKEYNAPEAFATKFLSSELLQSATTIGYKSLFWETLSQETVSPPPRQS